MSETPFSLIKKRYASIQAAATASGNTQGAIVFDKEHKVICVNGDVYGGAIQDVNYDQETNRLTIVKADGTQQALDFSDVASAQGTMAVFGQIRDMIGVENDGSVQGKYSATTYLQGVQTLVNADKMLDEEVHKLQGAVQGLQQVAYTAQGVDLGVAPIEYEGITVQGPDGTAAKNAQDAFVGLLQGIVDNEKVTEQAFEAVQNAVGLDEHLNYVLPSDAWYTQGATSVGDAVHKLDKAVQGIVSESKTYAIVEDATPTTGYLKTYSLMQTVGGQSTQAGVKIDIPKDFLVKSATSGTVTEADKAQGGKFYNNPNFNVGDGYLDFVINTKDGTGTDEHLYINVNNLVDSYTGDTATVIVDYTDSSFTGRDGRADVNIDQTNNRISVTVADGAIGSNKLAAAAVQSANLQGGAVTTEKIADNAVTTEKIADDAVTSDKIADLAVQTNHIALQSVTSEKIAMQGVQGWNIAQGAITSDKLAADLVQVETNTPEIKVNDPENAGTTQGVTIATIGGKEVKAKVGMYWSEWSDDL